MLKIIKIFIKYTIATVATLLLALQIPSINTKVLQGIINIATPDDFRIRIKGITGAFPFNLKIDQIKLKDKSKKWLEIKKLTFDWHGVDILYGNIHLGVVHAEKVSYFRNPDMKSTDDPLILPRLNVDKLKVDAVEIPSLYQGQFAVSGKLKSPKKGDQLIDLDLSFGKEFVDTDRLGIVYEQHGIDYTIKSSVSRPITDFASLSPDLLKNTDGHLDLHVDLAGQTIFKDIAGSASLTLANFKSPDPKLNEILGDSAAFLFSGALAESTSNIATANLKLKDRDVVLNFKEANGNYDIEGRLRSSFYSGDLSGKINVAMADINLTGTGGQASVSLNTKTIEIVSLNADFKSINQFSRFIFYPIWGEVSVTGAWDTDNKHLKLKAKNVSATGRSELFSEVEGTVFQYKNQYKAEIKAENADVKIKVSGSSDEEINDFIINELICSSNLYDKSRLIELKKPNRDSINSVANYRME
jgi:autotransporter translocation and assembly factor TamB